MMPRGTFVVSDPRKVRARGRAAPESPAVAVAVALAAMTTTTHSTSAVAAFVAGAFVAGAVAATALRRRVRGDDFGDVVGVGGGGVGRGGGDAVRCVNVERDAGGVRGVATVPSTSAFDMSDEILREQFTRNVQFFGERGQSAVRDAFVVVVGLGGVGSHAAHMILRSGVGKLRVIDFDQVSLSSLNRHATATRADVGTAKATCLKKHFAEIYPEADVDARVAMYEADAEEELLGSWFGTSQEPDFVVDCIDNIDTKIALLAACVRRNIRVVTSGGAGAKCDPTRLRFADIADCAADPLARAVRYRLNKEYKIQGGITALISIEKQRCELVAEMELKEGETLSDYQVIPNFRVRTIPVLGCVPAIFGMALASHVLTEIAEAPFDGEPLIVLRSKQYDTQLDRLRERENERGREVANMAVDLEDVIYLVREVWSALSARDTSNKRLKAYWRNTSGLSLTRWDPAKGATLDNLVLLTTDEADAHDAKCALEGGFVALCDEEPDLAAFVASRLNRVKLDFGLP